MDDKKLVNLDETGAEARVRSPAFARPGDPVRQEDVYALGYRVVTHMLTSAVLGGMKGWNLGVWHLWFPENRLGCYELRQGNPPADDPRDRPEHLRGVDLVIDLTKVKAKLWDGIEARLNYHKRSKKSLVETAMNAAAKDPIIHSPYDLHRW